MMFTPGALRDARRIHGDACACPMMYAQPIDPDAWDRVGRIKRNSIVLVVAFCPELQMAFVLNDGTYGWCDAYNLYHMTSPSEV